MTTSLQLITRALVDLQAIEAGVAPTAQEASDGLDYLNDLIQSLDNEDLTIYAATTDALTLTGATSYTFGTSGVLNSARPMSVLSAYFTLNSIDYPITILSREQYEAIGDKTMAIDIPAAIYVNYTFPLATVYVYPVPSSGTLNITSNKPLTELALLTTVLSVPKGYERMLRLNLASEMMAQYGTLNQKTIVDAQKAKQDIQRTNAANRKVRCGLGLPTRNGFRASVMQIT
jgi:hypothetical protein